MYIIKVYVFAHKFLNKGYLCGGISQKLIQVDASGEMNQVSGDRSGWETSEEWVPGSGVQRRNCHQHWDLRQARLLAGAGTQRRSRAHPAWLMGSDSASPTM